MLFYMAITPPSVRILVGRIRFGAKSEKSSDLLAGPPISIQHDVEVEEKPSERTRQDRVVILTATDVECDAVRQHLDERLGPIIETQDGDDFYEEGWFQSEVNDRLWNVIVREIGEGNVNATLHTGSAIKRYEPKIILFLGTAGGKELKVEKGDVVVATLVYQAMAGKIYRSESGGLKIGSRPHSEKSNETLVNLARFCKRRNWQERIKQEIPGNWGDRIEKIPRSNPHVHIKPLISTDFVWTEVESDLHATLSERFDDAVAWEMEGFGFLTQANHKHTVAAGVIRGISDFMQDKAQNDEEGWREAAMMNASAFAFELIANYSYSGG
jgi:nucleoside phosphorylase